MTETAVETVCVDASLAVKLVLVEENSDIALDLYQAWRDAGKQVIAPALITWEVSNALRKTALGGRLPKEAVGPIYDLFSGMSIQLIEHGAMPRTAWVNFVLGYDLFVSPYDATYLAAAEAADCELWTADDRLVRTVVDELPWVRSLSEIADAQSEA